MYHKSENRVKCILPTAIYHTHQNLSINRDHIRIHSFTKSRSPFKISKKNREKNFAFASSKNNFKFFWRLTKYPAKKFRSCERNREIFFEKFCTRSFPQTGLSPTTQKPDKLSQIPQFSDVIVSSGNSGLFHRLFRPI